MKAFNPADIFPDVQIKTRDGEEGSLIPRVTELATGTQSPKWYAVFIYRGQHCPICAKYLNKLEESLDKFKALNVDVIAVSADSVGQLNDFYDNNIPKVSFPVYAELKRDVIENMGLFLTEPMTDETDHVFSEPALFVVNAQRKIQIKEVANAPFVRPEIDQLLGGIEYIQKNRYPVRGTFSN